MLSTKNEIKTKKGDKSIYDYLSVICLKYFCFITL